MVISTRLSTLRRTAAAAALAALMVAGASGAAHATDGTDGTDSTSHGRPGTSEFRGVNWADPRDNYASDAVVPSGLHLTDDYATVRATTMKMVAGFRANLGANTIRLPINPATVSGAWWSSYRGAIDAATAAGDKVIVSYWESDTSKDGLVDNVPAWTSMWNTVVAAYRHNPRVYFEPMNEPHGYTLDQWVGVTSGWLAAHRNVPRNRVVISGTGYNDDVTGVGAARQLKGTLLSLHFYGYWASYTQQSDWEANLQSRIGAYAGRTIIDEAGSPMTIGLNYGAHNGNVYTSYFAALTDLARANRMGIVYWPGLRFKDSYSIESLQPDGTLTNNSASGVAQLRWGYGFGKVEPVNDLPAAPPGEVIQGVASNRCVDVPGFSTDAGTQLDLWDCNGGGNQSWNYDAGGRLTVYGSMCMQAGTSGASVQAGDPVIIAACGSSITQQWTLDAAGTITSAADPGLCLDAAGAGTGNGTAVDVWYCNGATNQLWTRQ